MVIALKEECRSCIESEYGSIIEFKHALYRAGAYTKESIKALNDFLYDAISRAFAVFKELSEYLISLLSELLKSDVISETFEKLKKMCNNVARIESAPTDHKVHFVKVYEKVPLRYDITTKHHSNIQRLQRYCYKERRHVKS